MFIQVGEESVFYLFYLCITLSNVRIGLFGDCLYQFREKKLNIFLMLV